MRGTGGGDTGSVEGVFMIEAANMTEEKLVVVLDQVGYHQSRQTFAGWQPCQGFCCVTLMLP